jgi:hypothetical protein
VAAVAPGLHTEALRLYQLYGQAVGRNEPDRTFFS